MRTILTLIIAIIFTTFSQAQNANLRLNLKIGETYKQKSISKSTIIQEINGQNINMVMTINGTTSFYVDAIIDEAYKMDVKFVYLSMTMEMPQVTMEFNSEKNDSNDIFSSIFAAMIDRTFEVRMNKSGKITDIKNVESLWENVINKFDKLPETQKEQMKTQIMKAYGAEALKGNIEMVTAMYPDKKVKKGDKWTINTKLESGMAGNMTSEYEFVNRTSDHVFIKGISSIATEDKDAYIETNGMPMRYDLTGSMVSDIKVDRNSGWIIEAAIKQEIKGNTFIKENPQMPNGMKIPMTMITDMVITNN